MTTQGYLIYPEEGFYLNMPYVVGNELPLCCTSGLYREEAALARALPCNAGRSCLARVHGAHQGGRVEVRSAASLGLG